MQNNVRTGVFGCPGEVPRNTYLGMSAVQVLKYHVGSDRWTGWARWLPQNR